MRILQLTAHFSPNVGGVETHLDDLVRALTKREYKVFVLTYRPLAAKANWKLFEKGRDSKVFRIPWVPGFFYKFVEKPFLEFLYLFPGLFLFAPLVLTFFRPEVVHAHGLVAGAVGVFWGKIFRKRVVITTHSVYQFPKKGLYRDFVKLLFSNTDFVMGLSSKSAEEIKSLGIPKEKVGIFTYWIDLEKFEKVKNAKNKLDWEGKFIVLFVGRLVVEKGVLELLESAKSWKKNIYLAIAGAGPLGEEVRSMQHELGNLMYLGKVENEKLPPYYSAADLLIVPSTHEEGFGRVILESLACGTPVIAAKRGAIPEAMNETVGRFIRVTPKSIKEEIEYLYKNKDVLKKLSFSTRIFAKRRFSEKNVEKIISSYQADY